MTHFSHFNRIFHIYTFIENHFWWQRNRQHKIMSPKIVHMNIDNTNFRERTQKTTTTETTKTRTTETTKTTTTEMTKTTKRTKVTKNRQQKEQKMMKKMSRNVVHDHKSTKTCIRRAQPPTTHTRGNGHHHHHHNYTCPLGPTEVHWDGHKTVQNDHFGWSIGSVGRSFWGSPDRHFRGFFGFVMGFRSCFWWVLAWSKGGTRV